MTSNNIKVCIKLRPLIEREINDNSPSQWSLLDENTIKSNNKEYKLMFDHIFDESRKTGELFEAVAKPIVVSAVNGINGTIFAYGQTSSGKTYCMMGTEDEPGIVPLCVYEIFKQIQNDNDREFLIRIGYIEIYNEKVYDLMDNGLEINKIHEASNGEVAVNQMEIVSSSAQVIIDHYNSGSKGRRVGETCMNDRSSRSHTIFRIVIESHEKGNQGIFHVSTLNLVDLAGSERLDQTKATGERMREGGHINKSLMSLSKVIRELVELNEDKAKNIETTKYINYRDSKLTRLLSASLGGNAMTAIICTITPVALEETYSTLTFASNAKKIKNQPKVNETLSDKVIMIRLQKEICALKNELQEEKLKNSETSKIQHIIDQIFNKESQIIHSDAQPLMKGINRRKTWCPMSSMEKIMEESSLVEKSNKNNNNLLPPPPPFFLKRESPNLETEFSPADDFLANEIFQSPNKMLFEIYDNRPHRDFHNLLAGRFNTPQSLKPIKEVESPHIGKYASADEENESLRLKIKYLQNELDELQDFKFLEAQSSLPNETDKVNQDKFESLSKQLEQNEAKVEMLENDIAEKLIELENMKSLKKTSDTMESEHKVAVEAREKAENILASVEYEYEQAQNKFKSREQELVQRLNEACNESTEAANVQKEKLKTLEEIFKKTEQDLFTLESQKKIDDKVEKVIKDLEVKLQKALEERQLCEQTSKEKNAEFETLSDQLLESIQEADNLQNNIKKLEESIKLKDHEFDAINLKLAGLEAEIENCIMKLQQTTSKTQTLETENRQLLSQIEENNRLNEGVEEMQKTIKELEEQLTNKNNNHDELLSRHENLTSRLQKIETLLVASEVDEIHDENDAIIKLFMEMRYEKVKIEAENSQLLGQIEDVQQSNSNVLALSEKVVELQNLIVLKDAERQELLENLSANDNLVSQLEKIKNSLNNDLAMTENEENDEICKLIVKLRQDAIKTEKIQAENECDQVGLEKFDEFKNKITELEDLIRLKTADCDDLAVKMTEQSKVVEKYRNIEEMLKINHEMSDSHGVCEIAAKLDENAEKMKELESVTQADDLQAKISVLNDKISVLNDKISSIEIEKQDLEVKFLESEITIEESEKIQEMLRNELNTKTNEIFELRKNAEQVESVKTENDKLQNDIVEMHKDVDKKSLEMAQEIYNLKESVQSMENANNDLNLKLTEQMESLEKYRKIQEVLINNETLSEDYFEDNFGKMIYKLHQTASRSESLENEKQLLLNEIAEIRQAAEILTEKLIANQTLTETEFQLREKNDALEGELKAIRKQLENLTVQNKEYEESRSDLRIKLEEHIYENEELLMELSNVKVELATKIMTAESLQEQIDLSVAKIQSYESEIADLMSKLDQSTVKIADSDNKLSKLDAELINSRSQLVIKDEEFKSMQMEIEYAKEQLNGKMKECDELKTRYRRRSEDNTRKLQELEAANSKLIHSIGAVEALKNSTEIDLKKLKEENQSLKDKNNDNDMEYTILDEKYSQLLKINQDLETKLKDEPRNADVCKKLEREVFELNEKISQQTSENDIKTKMVNELREKCENFVKENQCLTKKSMSPIPRRSDEKELFTAQGRHNLQTELSSGTPARTVQSNIDRKSRRQSIYDERRDLSAWELTESQSTQTDAVGELCACAELSEKIKGLQIEIRLRDSKLANAERMSKINHYKYDLEDAKKECQREKRENSQLKETLEGLKDKLRNVQHKNHELELNQKCHKVFAKSAQTENENVITKDEYEKVINDKMSLERKLDDLKKQLSQLKTLSEKENSVPKLQSMPSIESGISDSTNRLDYDTLSVEHSRLIKKYETAKKLCNLRMDDITKLRNELSKVTMVAENLSIKYEKAKQILDIRMEKIRCLRERLGENDDQISGENVTATLPN